MQNPASIIEKIIELTLSLNGDIADKEAYIKGLEDRLSILNTLKEVNYYMGAELELKNIIQIIIDVVVGVLGVSECSICLKRDNIWDIIDHSVLEKSTGIINFQTIDNLENELSNSKGEIIKNDLTRSEFMNLNCGSFIALYLLRGTIKYGIITIYYILSDSLSEGKIEFFKLISAQLGVHLENAYLYEKVKLASISDGLTGLYNRLHLNESLQKDGYINTLECAIIMIDIDNFKKANDTYGHIFGDTVIKTLSSILKNVEKKYDVIAFRYGGEEFLILCNNLCLEAVGDVAEDIRKEFFESDFKVDEEKTVNFSLSLGVSKFGYSVKTNDVIQLINCADEALYFSKKSGKNKCTISSGGLQLYMKSLEALNKAIARFNRFKKPFMLFKITLGLGGAIPNVEYNKIFEDISKSFRAYDTVFANSAGEFIGILEDVVECDPIKERLQKNLSNYNFAGLDMNSTVYTGKNINIETYFKLPEGFTR
jgi:diguanylate cyclase (GGDEF)-like protein